MPAGVEAVACDSPSRDIAALRLTDDPWKPGSYCIGHCLDVRFQAVVAWHLNHRAERGGRGNAEPIALTLHDQRRDRYLVELV
jgi:hypothetical protein